MIPRVIYKIIITIIIVSCLITTSVAKHGYKLGEKQLTRPMALSLDWKMHDVGNFWLEITNFGMFGGDNDKFTHDEFFISAEYPARSGIAHICGGGLWVGAIIDTSSVPGVTKKIKKVSFGYEGWGGDGWSQGAGTYELIEMWPSSKPADTIWVISKDHPEPPAGWDDFWGPNFKHKLVSDQDFICQYTDTLAPEHPIPNHIPLNMKVIQKSYAWSSGYAEAIIFFEYAIINIHPTRMLEKAYIGFFCDMDVGPIRHRIADGWPTDFWANNYTAFVESTLTAYIDNPVDKPSTPCGVTVVKTPKPLEQLNVSFHWYPGDRSPDPDDMRYDYLSNGEIMPSQSKGELSDTRFLFGFGPFDLMPRDTLHLVTAVISGKTVAEMLRNADRARAMYDNNYQVPPSPPAPPLKITYGDRMVHLDWSWEGNPDDPRNPEAFVDTTNYTAMLNFEGRVFEGFRLYRSEDPAGSGDSFALLHEWDRPGNIWGYNTGVEYSYDDSNLVTGRTYWYAVTSFAIEDTVRLHHRESLESGIIANTKKIVMPFKTYAQSGKVMVVPNPYRADVDYTAGMRWEGDPNQWKEESRVLRFINLPEKCTIRIFTLSCELVDEIKHDDPIRGEESWNLLSQQHISDNRRTIASGIYLFTVESKYGTQVGKFVVLK